MRPRWQEILMPSESEGPVWELFHENSKTSRYVRRRSEKEIFEERMSYYQSLPFEGYPAVPLPAPVSPLCMSLDQAIASRSSSLNLTPCAVTLEQLASLLFYSYGITRDNAGTRMPHPYRASPSAGALYPLEIFLLSSCTHGLRQGLYHYNPIIHGLRLLQQSDGTQHIANALLQPKIAQGASLVLFLTAVFERSVFKYGDRGYRYTLLEAGHVAQNINLVATSLGLGCMNIGGFQDRVIDEFLKLDGVTQSTIYLLAIGKTSTDC